MSIRGTGIQAFGNVSARFAQAEPNEFAQRVLKFVSTFGNNPRRLATKRSLIQWQVPHVGEDQYIEVYVNPENIQFSSRKEINRVRTKGGYIAQYWGEDLDTITLSGTTGDSGIEGINVLRDVYRSEQLALQQILKTQDKRRQSLMQLAAGIVMRYQEISYRGFFTDMSYTESVSKLGLFDYNLTFTVVQITGQRRNFLPWHRHPWSTTQTPNQGRNQTQTGSGFEDPNFGNNNKVGMLNLPPLKLETRVFNNQGNINLGRGAIQVAVLRGDSKDGSSEALDLLRISASGRRAKVVNEQIDDAIRKLQEARDQSTNVNQPQELVEE